MTDVKLGNIVCKNGKKLLSDIFPIWSNNDSWIYNVFQILRETYNKEYYGGNEGSKSLNLYICGLIKEHHNIT